LAESHIFSQPLRFNLVFLFSSALSNNIRHFHYLMLDIYGTNHNARLWKMTEEFLPERFRQWDKIPFNFIRQGEGDHYGNHRCAGEWITIELMHEGGAKFPDRIYNIIRRT
jgi:hypothetical protein